MKTFQFASIVAGLSFLKTTIAAGDDYITLGMTSIKVQHIHSVARDMWTMDIDYYKSEYQGRYPAFWGNVRGKPARKYPLLYEGKVWTHGSFMYYVVATEDLSYIRLYYEGTESCDREVPSP
ncbi:unnamed protein product [Blumeria hordei]|uniref:Uncharacterized protein n=2 Tax=Blumeria hordei TaxID=2867405 RepID=A0A383UQ58_BLUHO|nr:CSEP0371 putative effector protein [Blumeria hordei DH14]SZF01715.1 unnamed protein product [Blumeria hordei]